MTTIITRASKGSALTWTEGDANITNLNTDKIELTDLSASTSGDGSLTYNNTTGTFTYVGPGTTQYRSAFSAGTNITITDGVISSTASGGVTVSDDTTSTSYRYVLFEDVTSGTVSTVNVSSTKLLYHPSSGTLKTTILEGATLHAYREAIYDIGTTGGTVSPNVANGNVQKITLNAALTINGFTSPVAGQSLTLIIYGGTAYTAITSTMKFAGGVKTLTATAGCIDILSIYYDGTTYFASLNKGFA